MIYVTRKMHSILTLVVFALMVFLFTAPDVVSARDYVVYVDSKVADRYPNSVEPDCRNYNPKSFSCGTGNDIVYKSLSDINQFVKRLTSSDKATVLFKRGDSWRIMSDSDRIVIDKSNVTLDAYGTGAKPIIDGDRKYPTGLTSGNIPYKYAIEIGQGAVNVIRNVNIRNLRIQNMFPGGGILFAGAGLNTGKFAGPGAVQNCDFVNIGWAGVNIWDVQNLHGPSGAVKVENNYFSRIAEYARISGKKSGWPQALSGGGKYSRGHEARHNKLYDNYCEGIGAKAFSIVEYNILSDHKAPSIYFDPGKRSLNDYVTSIRYNLIWSNLNGSYGRGGGITVNDERAEGDNTKTEIEIYGNIVIGADGIQLKHLVEDSSYSFSPFKSVKVINNTLIDCSTPVSGGAFTISQSQRFREVIIKNNAFIINADSASACNHTDGWKNESWKGWAIGPNFFYGDGVVGNANLPAHWRNEKNIFATKAPLPKSSGWRTLTGDSSFSFADLYPGAGSQLISNNTVDRSIYVSGKEYHMLLTKGSEHKNLPGRTSFVRASQGSSIVGGNWVFGATIYSANSISFEDSASELTAAVPNAVRLMIR